MYMRSSQRYILEKRTGMVYRDLLPRCRFPGVVGRWVAALAVRKSDGVGSHCLDPPRQIVAAVKCLSLAWPFESQLIPYPHMACLCDGAAASLLGAAASLGLLYCTAVVVHDPF